VVVGVFRVGFWFSWWVGFFSILLGCSWGVWGFCGFFGFVGGLVWVCFGVGVWWGGGLFGCWWGFFGFGLFFVAGFFVGLVGVPFLFLGGLFAFRMGVVGLER